MKKTRSVLATLFTLVAPVGAHGQGTLAPGGIIDPRLVGAANADYAPQFFIGPLVFTIPNRFLIFPWPTGKHPFNPSVCAESTAMDDRLTVTLCKSDHRSVFLKIPIPGFAPETQNDGAISLVTLGFHELGGSAWLDFRASVEEFSAAHDDRWVRMRARELDTKIYAAFHDEWTGPYAKNAPPNILARSAGDFIFISKNVEDEPRALTCQTVLSTGDAHHRLRCNATVAFLAERFPKEPSGRYPYTIGFDLPGNEIDAVADVERYVTQAVLGFLNPSASTK